MGEYKFERVSEEKYNDLLFLMKAAFGVNQNVDYYKNKFKTDYLGVKHLGYVAYDTQNLPAAFYGVFPCRMEYQGKVYLCAQSGDTMTHPLHKGKGLFKTLGRMTNELAKSEGIMLMYGLPNKFSYHGLVKSLQWSHVSNMKNYYLKVVTFPLSGICKRFSFLLPLYNKYASFVLQSKKQGTSFFKSSAISNEFGGVYRDETYFDYKKFYNNHLIRLANINVWIKVDGALFIGDAEYSKEIDIPAFLIEVKKLAFQLGCVEVIFPLSKGTSWDTALAPLIVAKEGLALCLLDLNSGLPLDKFKFTAADFDTF